MLAAIPVNECNNRSPRVTLAGILASDVRDAGADHCLFDLSVVRVIGIAVLPGDDCHICLGGNLMWQRVNSRLGRLC